MKKIFIIIIFIFLPSFKTNDFVIKVIDGDTIITEKLGKIRILGIDTYDSNRKMAQKQQDRTGFTEKDIKYLAKEGKKFAIKHLLNREVDLISDYKDKDVFGRYLRYVYVDNKDYSILVLKSGLANIYCGDKKIKNFKIYEEKSVFKCY